MPKITYNWKRFYRRAGGIFNLSDAGFLVDPDGEYGDQLNPDVVPWDSLASTPCLILLGEPGIGKSEAMRSEVARIRAVAASAADRVLYVDLRSFQTDQRLHEQVFDSSVMQEWKADASRLFLFLDGLDECLMRIDNIASVLSQEFGELDLKRLNLRVACRTAAWPRDFEGHLQDLWTDDNVSVCELAPLRRVDVLEAARANGITPSEVFIEEVVGRGIVPFAIKPVTLQFLLNTRSRPSGMPTTQLDLYSEGCRLLCEDRRPGRSPARRPDELPAEKRLALASRIAALTMFCNRDAVWTDIDRGDVPPEDLQIRDLVTSEEGGENARLTEDEIFQALDTGLFSSRGIPRIGWAHQTYCEYLAARFLVDGKQPVETLTALLLHPDGKVIPQLRETAAWVATLVPEAFRRILAADPMCLLNSDAATADPNERRDLTENLLLLFEVGKLFDLSWGLWQRFPKLRHPGLAQQLRPFIIDRAKTVVVRRVAIMIAQTCEVAALEPELVMVALGQNDVHEIRVAAAFAISQFGGPASKQQLSALAAGGPGSDPDDDLKGCGLLCGWPGSLTTTQLFDALTPRKIPNRMGLYYTFLRREIGGEIFVADIPIALEWTAREPGCSDSIEPFSRLADEIRAVALSFVNCADIGSALASSTWAWLQAGAMFPSQHDKFKSRLSEEDLLRRELILRLFAVAARDSSFTFYLSTVLISKSDFGWLLDRFRLDTEPSSRAIWMELIRRVFDLRDGAHNVALAAAASVDRELASTFEWFLKPESAAADEVRRLQAEWDSRSPKISAPSPLDPPPAERVNNNLAQIEAGELSRFVDLNENLSLRPDSRRCWEGDTVQLANSALPGWIAGDKYTRGRILSAAKRYLGEYKPDDSLNWIETNSCPWDMLAGFRALILLFVEDDSFVKQLSPGAWSSWAALPLVRRFAPHQVREECSQLVVIAYRKAPTVVLDAFSRLIKKENERQGMHFVLETIDPLWDTTIEAQLTATLSAPDLTPSSFGAIIGALLRREVPGAVDIAKRQLESIPASGEQRDRALLVAQALIRESADAGWAILWPVAQQNKGFMLDALAGVSGIFEARQGVLGNKLSDNQLADLYIWLTTEVPYREETDQTLGFGAVSPSQSLAWFRDSLLEQLKRRATSGSCEALRRVAKNFPQYSFLLWHLMEAEQVARAASWVPISAKQLFALTSNPDKRLVQSGSQLLQVLVESLQRLEVEMQGETPTVFALWDERNKSFHPKNEGRLSDFVKVHFERDLKARGIVVNREVEIRRGTGSTPGEETDIHVDAIVVGQQGTYDRISAIIETKGCWNGELKTAIESQLVDRYLKENACPFGLYLVGWFVCAQWDESDYRKRETPKMTLDQAWGYFAEQANKLSNDARQVASYVANCALR